VSETAPKGRCRACADTARTLPGRSAANPVVRLPRDSAAVQRPLREVFHGVRGVVRAESSRHATLRDRIGAALAATVVVDAAATLAAYFLERNAAGTKIHSLRDAAFWTTTQLLTVSSQLPNPITVGGRILDVFLEAYAIVVVASLGGLFAAFFRHGDTAGS
jgi:hypothetical protein